MLYIYNEQCLDFKRYYSARISNLNIKLNGLLLNYMKLKIICITNDYPGS